MEETQTLPTYTVIILAAAESATESALPRLMWTVSGLPIIHYGVRAALDAHCDEVIVVLERRSPTIDEYLAREFAGQRVRIVVQEQAGGPGDAARTGLAAAGADAVRVLILYGDAPLVRAGDLRAVVHRLAASANPSLAVGSCTREDPPVASIFAGDVGLLRNALAVQRRNGELHLSSLVAFATEAGEQIATVALPSEPLTRVTNGQQLVEVERTMHALIAQRLRLAGAIVREGATIDANVTVEPDATIERGAVLRGHTRVSRGATVDVGCVLTNVEVGEGAVLKPYSVVIDSRIRARAQIGPFAYIRPDSDLGEDSRVGAFVEAKNTKLGRGAMANHLAFIGDGIIGAGANVSAGVIFCNSDGFSKFTTTVEDGAFIGSGSQIVAPVTVGTNAFVATGTTVTRDVPADGMAIGRVRQENKDAYASNLRARMKAAKQTPKK